MSIPTLIFPETLTDVNNVPRRLYPAILGYQPGRFHKTDIEEAFDGGEQTRARFDADGFGAWRYKTTRLDPRQAAGMRAFLRLARGKANNFWFTKPDEEWKDEYVVGTADGSSETDLNVRDAYGWSALLVDGVPFTDTFTVGAGEGTYGQDVIFWTGTTPGSGSVLAFQNFWAREVWIARLDSDDEIFIPFAGGADAIAGTGPGANPRLNVVFDLTIRAVKA